MARRPPSAAVRRPTPPAAALRGEDVVRASGCGPRCKSRRLTLVLEEGEDLPATRGGPREGRMDLGPSPDDLEPWQRVGEGGRDLEERHGKARKVLADVAVPEAETPRSRLETQLLPDVGVREVLGHHMTGRRQLAAQLAGGKDAAPDEERT
eukprot:CAMPEP_0175570026 /NCGR_PEP_ID=MMETSP0096-20121207/41783_1 /TAXON_ID=311494 /ORGANISM="Alexandrium monilatum, Strain CCMP3105" /LENGTH=151 /DNA_ID=CAMNT_0016873403 /DNA_START=43 /DNA_END=495 /DNA_ORIENTATION=-